MAHGACLNFLPSIIEKQSTHHRVVTSYNFVYYDVSIQTNSSVYVVNTVRTRVWTLTQVLIFEDLDSDSDVNDSDLGSDSKQINFGSQFNK